MDGCGDRKQGWSIPLLLAGKQKGSPDPFQDPDPESLFCGGCWKAVDGGEQFWLSWRCGCWLSWF